MSFTAVVDQSTCLANNAHTIAEFGDALAALRRETKKSLKDLVTYAITPGADADWPRFEGMSKTVLSNACHGYQLFRTDVQVTHFVAACGAKDDLDVWRAA